MQRWLRPTAAFLSTLCGAVLVASLAGTSRLDTTELFGTVTCVTGTVGCGGGAGPHRAQQIVPTVQEVVYLEGRVNSAYSQPTDAETKLKDLKQADKASMSEIESKNRELRRKYDSLERNYACARGSPFPAREARAVCLVLPACPVYGPDGAHGSDGPWERQDQPGQPGQLGLQASRVALVSVEGEPCDEFAW